MSNKAKKKTKQEIELMKAKAELNTSIGVVLASVSTILKVILDFILQLLK